MDQINQWGRHGGDRPGHHVAGRPVSGGDIVSHIFGGIQGTDKGTEGKLGREGL